MNLQELLDELRVNILNDRTDRIEGSSDYLWTDATLIRYINEAQRRFARQGLVIRDSKTTEVCEVTMQTGVEEYTLHQSVLAVISAKIADDTFDLRRGGHSMFDSYRAPDDQVFDVNQFASAAPGKPLVFSTDETLVADDNGSVSVVSMRLYPKPSADYNGLKVKLRVVRLPIEPLKGLKQVPEVPEDHHLDMLDWAAYLALRVVDHDAGNPGRAHEFRKMFENHVRDARATAMRKFCLLYTSDAADD
jgi:hypothetical protein